jgi:hypothetical protein
MQLTLNQIIMNVNQERADRYLEAKVFFQTKTVEERQLELEGVLPIIIPMELVEKQMESDKRLLDALLYIQRLVKADIEISKHY